MRAFLCVASLVGLVSCAQDPALDHQILDFSLTGTIVRVDREHRIATIKHEAITDSHGKLWMEPMTMEFPVREAHDLAAIRPGIRIRARVRQRQSDMDYWIDQVKSE